MWLCGSGDLITYIPWWSDPAIHKPANAHYGPFLMGGAIGDPPGLGRSSARRWSYPFQISPQGKNLICQVSPLREGLALLLFFSFPLSRRNIVILNSCFLESYIDQHFISFRSSHSRPLNSQRRLSNLGTISQLPPCSTLLLFSSLPQVFLVASRRHDVSHPALFVW